MAHKGEKANGSHYTSTRRSRKQPQKIAKPKKKISKRAALIKKAEKSGVKLRTDWSALYPKKPKPATSQRAARAPSPRPMSSQTPLKQSKTVNVSKEDAAYRRKLKRLGILKPVFKKKKMSS